jgi:hypothetical protein
MISYNWTIDKLTVAEDNLVVKVDWRVTAIDGNLSASAAGTRTLNRGDSFTPYEQLTEQQVLDWCFQPEIIIWTDMDNVEQSITKYIKDEGETQVAGQIARQLAQKQTELDLPWIQNASADPTPEV